MLRHALNNERSSPEGIEHAPHRLRLTLGEQCLPGRLRRPALLNVSEGSGPSPQLPEPHATLIPTINIAPAIGWPDGGKPKAATGTQVAAFADKLDHPRWLYVLPNGVVLVAETNAPPKPEDGRGLRGWAMGRPVGVINDQRGGVLVADDVGNMIWRVSAAR